MSIPKIIHYCWFGEKPLSKSAIKCIDSWKRYFPDFDIKEWNESNYNINKIAYIAKAYKIRKFALVSDFARYDVLNQYGGIYFDTDVEVIKSFDLIIENGSFLGMETKGKINTGLGCGFYADHLITKEIMEVYINEDLSSPLNEGIGSVVDITTNVFKKYGFTDENIIQKIKDTVIYPVEYFNPIDYDTHYLKITPNTYSIHHGDASWVDKNRRFTAAIHIFLCRIFGKKTGGFLSSKIRKFAKNIYFKLFRNEK